MAIEKKSLINKSKAPSTKSAGKAVSSQKLQTAVTMTTALRTAIKLGKASTGMVPAKNFNG